MICEDLSLTVEPYGPRLAQRIAVDQGPKGKEKSDAFTKSRIVGVALFLVWILLCFLPHGSTELARLQTTSLPHHQDALGKFQGLLAWGDWTTRLPIGTWLAIDTIAVVLAAVWLSIGITILGEFSRGHRFWGIALAYAAPTALISDLLENAATSLLAGPWITMEFLGNTVLGLPTPWMAVAVSVFLGVCSLIKLLAYAVTTFSFGAMVCMGIASNPRKRWLAKLG